MNEVTLQGKISNIFNGRNFSVVTLSVRDYKKEPYTNYLQITFTKNERAMLFDYEVGDYVTIKGTVKTEINKENNDAKPEYNQYIRGLWINMAKTQLHEKFGYSIKGYYKNINEVLISGNVISSRKISKNLCGFLIRPVGESFNVSITQFADSPEFLVSKYTGKNICAICELQTVKKEYDGESKHFLNIIAKESNTYTVCEEDDTLPFP